MDLDLVLSFGVLISVWIILMVKTISFRSKRKEKLYVLDIVNEPMKIKKIGYIMNELNPDSRELEVKRGAWSKKHDYKITNSIWEIKSDFKNYLDSTNTFLIVGSVKDHEIDCILTKSQLTQLKDSKDILTTLNTFVDTIASSELQEFRNTAQTTLLTIQKMHEIKNEMIEGLKHYGTGNVNATIVIKELFGLDDDEINTAQVEKILENHFIKKAQQEKAIEIKNNGDASKKKREKAIKEGEKNNS